MAAAVDQCKKEKKKIRSKELLQPPNGPGVSFLRKELCLPNGVSQKPLQTFKVDRSSILSQVKAFLPRLEKADRELQERLQGEGEGLDIEGVEEGEPCIEMDLAVVPLPHSDSEIESDLSDSDDDSSNSEDRTLKLKVHTKTKTGTIVEM
ncbi:uncharacterized protein LOC135346089 [Halichondria panicea]|uniref:uncharacterized protein LOC135346089 n=1 Tax=Halichondria panicea TaxID=6063 RepID=UPI00312B78C7